MNEVDPDEPVWLSLKGALRTIIARLDPDGAWISSVVHDRRWWFYDHGVDEEVRKAEIKRVSDVEANAKLRLCQWLLGEKLVARVKGPDDRMGDWRTVAGQYWNFNDIDWEDNALVHRGTRTRWSHICLHVDDLHALLDSETDNSSGNKIGILIPGKVDGPRFVGIVDKATIDGPAWAANGLADQWADNEQRCDMIKVIRLLYGALPTRRQRSPTHLVSEIGAELTTMGRARSYDLKRALRRLRVHLGSE